jgi:hypothetical protein
MTKIVRSTSYVFTADPQSAADMQQIAMIKKTVKSMNDQAKQSHYWAVKRAEYQGLPIPKAPNRYRVRLMGRGPRVQAALQDYGRKRAYDAYLPQEYAVKFDVYVSQVR